MVCDFSDAGIEWVLRDVNSSGSPTPAITKKPRKKYTRTKARECWTQEEHERFVQALELYQRDWKSVTEYIGTKNVVQVRSHAQKYFIKLEKNEPMCNSNASVPPVQQPRSKSAVKSEGLSATSSVYSSASAAAAVPVLPCSPALSCTAEYEPVAAPAPPLSLFAEQEAAEAADGSGTMSELPGIEESELLDLLYSVDERRSEVFDLQVDHDAYDAEREDDGNSEASHLFDHYTVFDESALPESWAVREKVLDDTSILTVHDGLLY